MGKLNYYTAGECVPAFRRLNVYKIVQKKQTNYRVIFHFAHVYYSGLDTTAVVAYHFHLPIMLYFNYSLTESA